MAGIIEKGNNMLEEDAEDAVLDACIIEAGERAEHYQPPRVRMTKRIRRTRTN